MDPRLRGDDAFSFSEGIKKLFRTRQVETKIVCFSDFFAQRIRIREQKKSENSDLQANLTRL